MGTHPIFESDFDCLTDVIQEEKEKKMNRSLNRSMDRSMDEKLYSLIEANVQITNETISQLESENDEVNKKRISKVKKCIIQLRTELNAMKDKNSAINDLMKSLRRDNEELQKANKLLKAQVKTLKLKKLITMIPLIIIGSFALVHYFNKFDIFSTIYDKEL